MNHRHRTVWYVVALTSGLLTIASILRSPEAEGQSPAAASPAAQAQPVESDMHELMEYVYQPTYKRLKQSMASANVDNALWKAIKADSLILAEAGNLLLMRPPKDDVASWIETSVATRDTGGKLYQAAKAKDMQAARQHYEAMLKKCNACHDRFADGEHQLTP